MADAATTPAVTVSGVEDQTPTATKGFGAREQADETRQSSQGVLNDVQLDLNFQQVVVRSQGLTVDVLGKAFVASHDRLAMIQERFLSGVKA